MWKWIRSPARIQSWWIIEKLSVAKVSGKTLTNGEIWWDYEFDGRHSNRRSSYYDKIKYFLAAGDGGDLGGVYLLFFHRDNVGKFSLVLLNIFLCIYVNCDCVTLTWIVPGNFNWSLWRNYLYVYGGWWQIFSLFLSLVMCFSCF